MHKSIFLNEIYEALFNNFTKHTRLLKISCNFESRFNETKDFMRIYGLTGKTLSHSFSEQYFNNKFTQEGTHDAVYKLFPLPDAASIRELIEDNPDICGLNVTVPFKTAVMPFLDTLDPLAQRIGAVNTITVKRPQGRTLLTGHNTDYRGFKDTLYALPLKPGTKALILGSGGASKAVACVLGDMHIEFKIVSRSEKMGTNLLYSHISPDVLAAHLLLINTTPLGMFPDTGSYPELPYDALGASHVLYDLVYNPEVTKFMQKGIEKNAYICNGLNMLHRQADLAWHLWQNEKN